MQIKALIKSIGYALTMIGIGFIGTHGLINYPKTSIAMLVFIAFIAFIFLFYITFEE